MNEKSFELTMPETYSRVFDAVAALEHGEIAAHRRQKLVHVERWRKLPGNVTVVCVVAADRGGLLSFITAALARHHLVIRSAQVYTRNVMPEPEAVDFFWVAPEDPEGPPVTEEALSAIEDYVTTAMSGTLK
jgi:UTP:GlnB (protein PII) uridylyltransferase